MNSKADLRRMAQAPEWSKKLVNKASAGLGPDGSWSGLWSRSGKRNRNLTSINISCIEHILSDYCCLKINTNCAIIFSIKQYFTFSCRNDCLYLPRIRPMPLRNKACERKCIEVRRRERLIMDCWTPAVAGCRRRFACFGGPIALHRKTTVGRFVADARAQCQYQMPSQQCDQVHRQPSIRERNSSPNSGV